MCGMLYDMSATTELPYAALTRGERLRKARLYAGLEQTDLADALGVSRSLVAKFENGDREVRQGFVVAWARECSRVHGDDTETMFAWLWAGETVIARKNHNGRPDAPWETLTQDAAVAI